MINFSMQGDTSSSWSHDDPLLNLMDPYLLFWLMLLDKAKKQNWSQLRANTNTFFLCMVDNMSSYKHIKIYNTYPNCIGR